MTHTQEQLPPGAEPSKLLSGEQLETFAELEGRRAIVTETLAPTGVELLLHTGVCSECNSKQVALGALVTVYVAGMELSREYALDGANP